jgi:A/G-specific adenine glycosylase
MKRPAAKPRTTRAQRATPAAALASWYARHGRHTLPWRNQTDPYRVLVSEMMLQQTQVERVIPYYERWLLQFPTLEALAAANEEDVLRAWAGLGYYRRARALWQIARAVAAESTTNGEPATLPDTRPELEHLPGIGAYTAGAVLAFAHNQPEPALDTNVRRVLCRVTGEVAHIGSTDKAPRRPVVLLMSLYKALEPRHALAAVMDLGALVCIAAAPKCGECPLASHCRAKKSGVFHLPAKSAPRKAAPAPRATRAAPNSRPSAIGALHHNGTLLLPRRGSLLHASPNAQHLTARAALKAAARASLGLEIAVRPACAKLPDGTTLHRCTVLYPADSPKHHALKPLAAATAARLARLPSSDRHAITLMRLRAARSPVA